MRDPVVLLLCHLRMSSVCSHGAPDPLLRAFSGGIGANMCVSLSAATVVSVQMDYSSRSVGGGWGEEGAGAACNRSLFILQVYFLKV